MVADSRVHKPRILTTKFAVSHMNASPCTPPSCFLANLLAFGFLQSRFQLPGSHYLQAKLPPCIFHPSTTLDKANKCLLHASTKELLHLLEMLSILFNRDKYCLFIFGRRSYNSKGIFTKGKDAGLFFKKLSRRDVYPCRKIFDCLTFELKK